MRLRSSSFLFALVATFAEREVHADLPLGYATLEVRARNAPLVLRSTNFEATGVDAAGYVRDFRASGGDLGLVAPRTTIVDVDLGIRARMDGGIWFDESIFVGGGGTNVDATPGDPAKAQRFDVATIGLFRLGVETGAGYSLGPVLFRGALAAAFGPVFGVSLAGMRPVDGRGGTSASPVYGWGEPKIGLEVVLPASINLGVYASANLLHPEERSVGLVLGYGYGRSCR